MWWAESKMYLRVAVNIGGFLKSFGSYRKTRDRRPVRAVNPQVGTVPGPPASVHAAHVDVAMVIGRKPGPLLGGGPFPREGSSDEDPDTRTHDIL
jgi:hypothetical protein